MLLVLFSFFFFNDTATTEIYTLSLDDALPISLLGSAATGALYQNYVSSESAGSRSSSVWWRRRGLRRGPGTDRKSTRLNSSHEWISYAVFCLKKKNKKKTIK